MSRRHRMTWPSGLFVSQSASEVANGVHGRFTGLSFLYGRLLASINMQSMLLLQYPRCIRPDLDLCVVMFLQLERLE
jgi:hypothetical protein